MNLQSFPSRPWATALTYSPKNPDKQKLFRLQQNESHRFQSNGKSRAPPIRSARRRLPSAASNEGVALLAKPFKTTMDFDRGQLFGFINNFSCSFHPFYLNS